MLNMADNNFLFCFIQSSTFFSSLVTLFQLVTLDKWYKIYQDLAQFINPASALFYILLWIMVGSFIFRNLIIGFMGALTCAILEEY